MRPNLLMTIILPQLISCQSIKYEDKTLPPETETRASAPIQKQISQTIGDIATPRGFTRTLENSKSFGSWLRGIHLKKETTVFLYNGDPKANQSAQFAVLDIPVGKKDLQQCADAVMRLRAQFLFDHKRFNEICFNDNNGKQYRYSVLSGESLDRYLEKVYSYCGTLSLARQLQKTNFHDMQIGDVLIRGGSPGHAVIVVDMAVNQDGKKLYLLAQSYMPAQDIHILKNPERKDLSPWYPLPPNGLISTPEWVFTTKELKTW